MTTQRLVNPAFIVIMAVLAVSLYGQSQREKDAVAQHLRDIATIDRLVKENEAAKLSSKSVAATGKAVAGLREDVKKASAENQQAASDVADSAQSTRLELAKLRAEMPINSSPVWLAAIAALVTIIGTIGSISLAVINRKINEVHVLADGNLSTITAELKIANDKIAALQKLAGETHRHGVP